MINAIEWFKDKGLTFDDKITIKDLLDLQKDARREGMKDAAKILETLPCIRHDGKQASEYIKAGLREGYKAIMAARDVTAQPNGEVSHRSGPVAT